MTSNCQTKLLKHRDAGLSFVVATLSKALADH
jgi:hypothetical protein